ncbi:copper resistance protein NlpE N-terminal domain-containing protein [Chromatocurvus halotolerans]|uniref:copper resistance protein NlpE N-terminal domain-containing protein n=1 Tax=Chromatocurvus halotolerans TaxID=1132028 RepID=UPI0013C31AD3|nr:copper resistance protein NlpE N-terminal domain-containing protein [Chromatocurvus halotolerans]
MSGCSDDADPPETQTINPGHEDAQPSADTPPQGQASLPTPADTSRLALDWAGTYSGTLPCASCPGIETVITLYENDTYERSLQYLNENPRPVTETGAFTWNDAGSIITLDTDDNGPRHYQVREHHLLQLDMQGQPIQGDLAERYILDQHLEDPAIEDVQWRLIELNGKAIAPQDHQTQPFFTLQSETSQAVGNTSCNSFNGTYSITRNQRIDFGENLAMTRMACSDMNTEQAFLDMLTSVRTYALEDDNSMMLRDSATAPVARLIKAGNQ